VPFYLRTGKRLAERAAEIVVVFREVPHLIFETASGLMSPNHLVIRLQPDEGLKLFLMAKAPGDEMRLRPVSLNLGFAETFKAHQTDPHERLLIEIIYGRLALFVRHDELEAAWRWIDPILKAWEAEGDRPRPYTAGTWGPAAATVLISRDGFSWYEEG
jgi:glucose-6-phosphate 1-dehydrogenase